ncbi:RIB43A-like with coiled-coils protein 1 [Bombina bombina]|uniref:RIB43A-like with coiled-coils protein 1 n=1 Tax=Bombina bombina TaxID=8345 RepID=UPI00235A9666|nr:RIB43A-like with coiled-coils protein 1 [Bombina bombina]
MYKVDLPPDLKEAAAIERRRNREQQRQSRVFNAKFRTIGVDVDTLEKQVQEKKQKEEIEKARDEAFDASRQHYDKIAQMLEQEQQAVTRNLDVALEDFRVRHQQPDTRREFDLYDPQGLKKDRPARVCDDDPRCGPASLQKFAGEDLSEKERAKLQKDMIKKWLTLQNEETQRAEAQQKFADNLYDKKRIELDERAQHLSRMEEECRKAIDMATNNFNEALALEITERRNLEKQQEEDNNFAEIYNHLTGDILTENPDVAVSNLGPQRILTDRWKGMSPEELKAVWNIQEQQRQEKQRLNEEEKQRDAEWDRQRTLAARASMTLEQQEEEFNKELRKRIDSYNEQLGREQRAHLEYLQKEVYTNKPTAHFFTQFNTSSR